MDIESKLSELEDKIDAVLKAVEDIGATEPDKDKAEDEDKEQESATEAKTPSVDVDAVLEAGKKLAESGLPEAAVSRVRESVKAGKDIDEAIEAERAYIKEATAKYASPHVEEDGSSLKESYKKIGWA